MSDNDLRAELERARSEGLAALDAVTDLTSLEEAKVKILGRKAPLSRARSSLRSVAEEDRKVFGQLANEVQQDLERVIESKMATLTSAELEARWERERIDVTLPGDPYPTAAVHPLTKTIWEIVDIFIGLGYKVAEGPEVELSRYNFDALNTPPEHPSRSPQDTFYIEGAGEDVCLRSQTSPMQMRMMELHEPPLYLLVPGRVYRREDEDATHLICFTQIEGLAVDEGITMSDLKGTLELFAREVFGKDLDVRLRPHFFPFTEPSAELDVQCFVCRGAGCRLCKGEGWIEILGCGVIDPFLYEWAGYDPERYGGFAFGMGVERIASLAHGVNDIRYFWENDLRFLKQFRSAV